MRQVTTRNRNVLIMVYDLVKAAWVFLLVPQLLENYQQGSADGISLTFLFIWFVRLRPPLPPSHTHPDTDTIRSAT